MKLYLTTSDTESFQQNSFFSNLGNSTSSFQNSLYLPSKLSSPHCLQRHGHSSPSSPSEVKAVFPGLMGWGNRAGVDSKTHTRGPDVTPTTAASDSSLLSGAYSQPHHLLAQLEGKLRPWMTSHPAASSARKSKTERPWLLFMLHPPPHRESCTDL